MYRFEKLRVYQNAVELAKTIYIKLRSNYQAMKNLH